MMIELEGLTKKFDEILAVDRVTLNVRAGEVLALLGPNGAGKTTTVRLLSAILQPTAGRARVAGYDTVAQSREVRSRVGVLTEAPGLYTRMTGREYLDFFGEVRGLATSERRDRIAQLGDKFFMTFALDRRLGQYSKGMAQKISLMRTLLHEPSVLLLDEPTSAMDPQSARLVRNTILQLRSTKRAIVVCTHNLAEAEELADRIAIIRQGAIVAQGSPLELKTQLLGPPVMEARFTQPSSNNIDSLVSEFVRVEESGVGWLRYRTEDPEETNPAVLHALLSAGVPVLTLQEVPRSLEAVYLRVVEEA
ncbi:MAG: ABC transporter ATP-binding protein [Anaerolineae bacterium]